MFLVARELRTIPRWSRSACFSTTIIYLQTQRQARLFDVAQVRHQILSCRGGGTITLDIHEPAAIADQTEHVHFVDNGATTSLQDPQNDVAEAETLGSVLIYLPCGIKGFESVHGDDIQPSALAAATKLPVIKIKYRLSSEHRYPIPLWDVLMGYDWIVKSYLPFAESGPKRSGGDQSDEDLAAAHRPPRIGIYGSYIGGSLALALGLTECRISQSENAEQQPARIVSVATHNAITDWPRLAPLEQVVGDTIASEPPQHVLEAIRSDLFSEGRIRDAFDPFISPALFFRTPGVEVPAKANVSATQLAASSRAWASAPATPASDAMQKLSTTHESKDQSSGRVYARRFPHTSMGPVILPNMQLFATSGTIYETQNVEFAKFVHRAMIREALPSGTGQKLVDEVVDVAEIAELKHERDETVRQARQVAESRCRLNVTEGEEMEIDQLASFLTRSINEKT